MNARDRSDDVLALYDGTQEGLIAARDAVDAIHAEEVDSGLTMPMVGVIADPFADLV